MKATKSKIVKWVSVALLSAIILGMSVIPVAAAGNPDNVCNHNSYHFEEMNISYPNANLQSHQKRYQSCKKCNVCGYLWDLTGIIYENEAHTVVGTHCVKCGYNMESSAR